MTRTAEWKTGWTAANPLEIGYVAVGKNEGKWEPGARPYLEYRDLGLAGVTDGKMGVLHIRSKEAAASDWHCHDCDFQFVYVLAGRLEVENEHGDRVGLGPGDTLYHAPFLRHRERISAGYQCIEIAAPAKIETIAEFDAGKTDLLRPAVYTYERPESYARGNGPRKCFLYRDLGTNGPTDTRIHIHVVRATEPGAGTGWHYHSMAQWFLILGGSSWIRVEDRPKQRLEAGDTMCIGRGPGMRHNVAPYSGDYAVLEMCVPAEYETTAVSAPDGADSPPKGAEE
jgi:quercetin dioxygenase-like cupin family protein